MLIQFLSPSPKAGTCEDVENTAGRALCCAGLATEIKYKNHVERLAALEKKRVAALPPPTEQWAINPSRSDNPSAPRFIVMHTSVNGITYYDAPPATAPAHVKQRFADLVATDSQAFVDRSNFLKQQADHVEPKTPGLASVTDIARALIRGKR